MAATWLRPAVLILAIVSAALLANHLLGAAWTPDRLRDAVTSAGPWAPVLYVLAYVVATVLLLPGLPLTLLAGVLFGPLPGILWAWVGGNLGALAAYAAGRSGSGPVHRWIHERVKPFAKFMDAHSFVGVLTLRLVPIVPFNLLNYALGLAGVQLRAYATATLLGVIPATTAYVLFGAALGNLARFREPAFYVPLVVAIVLTLVASFVSARLQRRAGAQAEGAGP